MKNHLLESIFEILSPSLYEVYELEEDFKSLPTHLKKTLVNHFGGGSGTNPGYSIHAKNYSELNNHIGRLHKLGINDAIHVVHKDGKPIAAIHAHPGDSKHFAVTSGNAKDTHPKLKKLEAHAALHSIIAKHTGATGHNDKSIYKNHKIEVKSYGRDWTRDPKSDERQRNRKVSEPAYKTRALTKHLDKHIPNANRDDKDEYKKSLHGKAHGSEWDKQYSKYTINDLKAKYRTEDYTMSENPRLHIIPQLQRAKLSMTGGSNIMFEDGSTDFVSGTSASILLDKYSDMKPFAKQEFQKQIGWSLEKLTEELKGD